MIPNRILVATDGSPAAREAEALAADMARLKSVFHPVEVIVATVVHDVGHVPEEGGVIPKSIETREAERISGEGVEHIRSLLAGEAVAESMKVEAKVIEALSPGAGIVGEAHATGVCSLIIMGNRGLGGVAEAFLGSVSQQVVHEAHCPILIARA